MLKQIMTLAATINNDGAMEYYLSTDAWRVPDEDIVVMHPFEIEFKVPNISESELKAKAIKTLVDKQDYIMKEAFRNKKKLQLKIDDLLCIEILPEGTKHKFNAFISMQDLEIYFTYYEEKATIEVTEILGEFSQSLMDGYIGESDTQESIELACWEYLEGNRND